MQEMLYHDLNKYSLPEVGTPTILSLDSKLGRLVSIYYLVSGRGTTRRVRVMN
jgi:hypothetical protein